jgi:putative nucleotidyltransferase with HDIG domain
VVEQSGPRWVTRPWLGLALRIAVLGVPLVVAFATVEVLRRNLPESLPRWQLIGILAAAAVFTGLVTERLARRLLPLSSLLGMTMLFPDRAPSRLRVFRMSASTRQLHEALASTDTRVADAAATTLALITALSGHDRRTRGHSERVRAFADLLADELALGEADRDRLRWAALLHDIGKLEIAVQVLNKKGELDAAEWDRIRLHPLAGMRLAGPLMGWLGEWGGGIGEHHERYDGTGYPQGLTGTDISRAGRIVAVVDAFETMTAARTYKKPMNTRAARAELARCAGAHFDPQVVRAFLGISLPRLLWAMGPVAFVVHLPYLRSLELAGAQVGSAVATGAGATAIAVGVAVVPAAPPVQSPRPVVEQVVTPGAADAVSVFRLRPLGGRAGVPAPSGTASGTPRSVAPTPTDLPPVVATPDPPVPDVTPPTVDTPEVPRDRVPPRVSLPGRDKLPRPRLPVPQHTVPLPLPTKLPVPLPTELPLPLPLPLTLPLPEWISRG